MSGMLARRLATLERDMSPVSVWACLVVDLVRGETVEGATKARFPEGRPAGINLVVVELADATGGTDAVAA